MDLILALTLNPIALLIWLFVACLVIWAARAIMAAFGIGDPISTIVQVVLIVIFLLMLLGALGGGSLGNLRIT